MKISQWKLHQAINWYKNGEIFAYPTESVFGLGCDPDNEEALVALIHLKRRSYRKGLIIVASDIDQIREYIDNTYLQQLKNAETIKKTESDQATTWLLPASERVSDLICGTKDQLNQNRKIAIRISDHPFIKEFCNKIKKPLVSTSANITEHRVCHTGLKVKLQFQTRLKRIIYYPRGKLRKTSKIIDLISNKVIRS